MQCRFLWALHAFLQPLIPPIQRGSNPLLDLLVASLWSIPTVKIRTLFRFLFSLFGNRGGLIEVLDPAVCEEGRVGGSEVGDLVETIADKGARGFREGVGREIGGFAVDDCLNASQWNYNGG